MARKKEQTLVIFREAFELTGSLTNEQFGRLMRALFRHRFGMEEVPEADPEVAMALGFICAQSDRYEAYCRQNREAARTRCAVLREEAAEETQENTDSVSELHTPENSSYGNTDTAESSEGMQSAAQGCTEQQKAAEGDSTSTSTSTSNNIFGNILLERPPPAAHTQILS